MQPIFTLPLGLAVHVRLEHFADSSRGRATSDKSQKRT